MTDLQTLFHWIYRGGSRGRVQGVRTPPEMNCGFLIQLVFCKVEVEVEQETSAPPWYRCAKGFVFNFSRQHCSSQVKLKILLMPANFCEENKLHYGANVKIAHLIKLKRHYNKRTYHKVTKDLIDQHWNSPRQYVYYRNGMKYDVENI